MNNRFFFLCLLTISLSSCHKDDNKNYLQYVNMFAGTAYPKVNVEEFRGSTYIYGGQVIPAVTYPFGMTQWTLQTQSSEREGMAPFYSGKIRFQGFRATHWLNGSCNKDYGSFTIFPTDLNNYRFLPNQRETMFMYNTQTSTPAYMSVLAPEQNVMTEVTATKRCAMFKISWLDSKLPSVIFDVNSDEGKGFIKIDVEENEIYGYNPVYVGEDECKESAGIAGFFVIKYSKKLKDYGMYSGMSYSSGETVRQNSKDIGAYITFDLQEEDAVKLKVGTSFTSIENARANLEVEIPDWDFNNVKRNLELTWNNVLGKIDIESDTKEDVTIFYTSLYRCLLQPRLYSDVNGEYRGFGKDTSVYIAKDFDYYGDFAAKNTYKAQMPLLSLIVPDEYCSMVKSLIVKAEQGGGLPLSTFCNNYTNDVSGDYCAAIISDAYVKGFEFDVKKAYYFMRKNAVESSEVQGECFRGRPLLDLYKEYGYIPIDNNSAIDIGKGEVSLTLDYSYNDYCLAIVAEKLGIKKDYEEFLLRSYNYTNLFDLENVCMRGKYSNDTFIDDYIEHEKRMCTLEGTQIQYTFFVPHDIPGLIELFGGEVSFENKLNDITGGNALWPGNEPGQIIPYLYNFIGEWNETQETVKSILNKDYSTAIDGFVRNDEGAQMSAWYIFSSMGFYPVCPVSNTYQLSAPIFNKITIDLDDTFYSGRKFVIRGQRQGDEERPYSKVEFNGQKINPVITYQDIKTGGDLRFIY